MCSRCESCDKLLSSSEMFRTVKLEDGTTKEVIDNMCNGCISMYVDNADSLETKTYQHQDISDRFWDNSSGNTNVFDENA